MGYNYVISSVKTNFWHLFHRKFQFLHFGSRGSRLGSFEKLNAQTMNNRFSENVHVHCIHNLMRKTCLHCSFCLLERVKNFCNYCFSNDGAVFIWLKTSAPRKEFDVWFEHNIYVSLATFLTEICTGSGYHTMERHVTMFTLDRGYNEAMQRPLLRLFVSEVFFES